MKTLYLLFSLSMCLMALGPIPKKDLMSLNEAQKLWGKAEFNKEKFKSGAMKDRASMAVSLIGSKQFIGKTVSDIRELLGEWDGYFETDSIPAYLLTSRKPKEKKDAWQLLFLTDEPGGKIRKIVIHKNCCSDGEY